ncbi:MAG: uridine diphosphate-N-acetylglucosamine-binding protein YvcK [Myxococcales bacterium]|nr:MAG: uridine diphosphate-N-acetylglucosamine-binding protein YvcK [Myxococcales bacterium]
MAHNDPRVVALGGGHGLAASLTALRHVTSQLTAVVTVADNGGSSGRLRREFGVLPPGDLRMALAALCGDDRWGQTWAEVLQHRFASGGEMNGHSLGNLLILSLWELLDDQVAGLDWVGGLLGARGRVLPMANEPLDIVATVSGLDPANPEALCDVRGQVEVATTAGRVEAVRLVPANPGACPEALDAIASADWVVLGPGSWYSSVLPHLLVPDLREALLATRARIAVTMNLEAQPGETDGLSVSDHLDVLMAHAPGLPIDAVLAASSAITDPAQLAARVQDIGARLVLEDLAVTGSPGLHDPIKLGRAYAGLLGAN